MDGDSREKPSRKGAESILMTVEEQKGLDCRCLILREVLLAELGWQAGGAGTFRGRKEQEEEVVDPRTGSARWSESFSSFTGVKKILPGDKCFGGNFSMP